MDYSNVWLGSGIESVMAAVVSKMDRGVWLAVPVDALGPSFGRAQVRLQAVGWPDDFSWDAVVDVDLVYPAFAAQQEGQRWIHRGCHSAARLCLTGAPHGFSQTATDGQHGPHM